MFERNKSKEIQSHVLIFLGLIGFFGAILGLIVNVFIFIWSGETSLLVWQITASAFILYLIMEFIDRVFKVTGLR